MTAAHRREAQPLTVDAIDREWLRALFDHLGERYTLYYPRLANHLGDPKTALFLGRVLSWTRLAEQSGASPNHWVWQSAERMTLDIGLSRAEQRTARRRLIACGLLAERRSGMPARLEFRIELDRLASSVTHERVRSWSWAHSRETLGHRPVAVHRNLVDIVEGDAMAAIYLAQLMTWTRAALLDGRALVPVRVTGHEVWFDPGVTDLRSQLGMTRKMQQRCRRELTRLGLIQERFTSGLTPKLLTAVSLDRVDELLRRRARAAKQETRQSDLFSSAAFAKGDSGTPAPMFAPAPPRARRAGSTDCGNPSIQIEEIQQSGLNLSAKQGWTNPQNRTGPFDESRLAERGTPLHREQEKEISPLLHPSPVSQRVATFRPAGRRRIDFDLSVLSQCPGIGQSELLEVDRLAQFIGEDAQLLIDELAYAMTRTRQQGSGIANPVAYFAALARKHQAGTFIPAGALRLREAATAAQAKAAVDAAQRTSEATQNTPELRERSRQAALAAISEWKTRRGRA